MAVSLAAKTLPNPNLTKQQVDWFGVGAKVKVQLAGGQKLRGSIEAIEDGAFILAARNGSPRRVSYDQVAQLKLAKVTYRGSGQPDPVEARRVVAGLGVGKHIMVKTAAGQEFHGNIQAIGADNFSILPDHQTALIQLAYTDVVQLGPNLSRGAKIAIIVVAAVLVTAAIVMEALGIGD